MALSTTTVRYYDWIEWNKLIHTNLGGYVIYPALGLPKIKTLGLIFVVYSFNNRSITRVRKQARLYMM
jgi:hypothetical protein